LLAACAAASAFAGEGQSLQYTVHLVRGTSDDKPPDRAAKLVSPKLAQKLSRFRWKNYWEIHRQAVSVAPPHITKVRLNAERDLHLEVIGDNARENVPGRQDLELRLYRDGKLARTARQNVQLATCEIMGGTGEKDNSWFVIVRRDKPQEAAQR
jgi:hypothetical protein